MIILQSICVLSRYGKLNPQSGNRNLQILLRIVYFFLSDVKKYLVKYELIVCSLDDMANKEVQLRLLVNSTKFNVGFKLRIRIRNAWNPQRIRNLNLHP